MLFSQIFALLKIVAIIKSCPLHFCYFEDRVGCQTKFSPGTPKCLSVNIRFQFWCYIPRWSLEYITINATVNVPGCIKKQTECNKSKRLICDVIESIK